MNRTRLVRAAMLIVTLIVTNGCESRDQRLADFAGQALDQQARQNEEMARQSEQVAQQSTELAQAAHKLVEQDAQARRELIQAQTVLQSQFHEERTGLDAQRQVLHAEQKAIAASAIREPVIAQAILVVGLLLATLLPLLVTAYALYRLPDLSSQESLLSNTLLEELIELPGRTVASGEQEPGLPDASAPRLPGSEQSADPGPASPDPPAP